MILGDWFLLMLKNCVKGFRQGSRSSDHELLGGIPPELVRKYI
jgi:hypothetical protein